MLASVTAKSAELNRRMAADSEGCRLELSAIPGGHTRMTSPGLVEQEQGAQERELRRNTRMARPPAYISDIWRAPLTDLPIRDEILFQYLPLPESAEVLEIGPGSGFTAFRFSRLVKQLVIVDIAVENIERLRLSLKPVSNLDFTCWDISVPGLAEKLGRQFDVVESI